MERQNFLLLKAAEVTGDGYATARPFSLLDRGQASLRPGHDYIRISILNRQLEPAFLKTRVLHPIVHCRAAAGDNVDFQTIDAAEFLSDAAGKRLGRLHHLPSRVIGPTPFRSDLRLEFGLFAATADDRIGEALSLLADMSAVAAIPFVGAALPIASVLKTGVERLFGVDTQLRFDVGFRGAVTAVASPGIYAIVYRGNGKHSPDNYRFDLTSGKLVARGGQLPGTAYLTFEIEAVDWREDWAETPDLQAAWGAIREAGLAEDAVAFDLSVRRFQRACLTSADLCRDQARALRQFASDLREEAAETFAEGFEAAGSGTRAHGFEAGDLEAAFAERYQWQDRPDMTAGLEAHPADETEDGFVFGNRRLSAKRRRRPRRSAGASRQTTQHDKPQAGAGQPGFEALDDQMLRELLNDVEDLVLGATDADRIADLINLTSIVSAGRLADPDEAAKSILKKLRGVRAFDLLVLAAGEFDRAGLAGGWTEVFRAQAQIELGLLDVAIKTLTDALSAGHREDIHLELAGLMGRAHKDAYLRSSDEGTADESILERSIGHYASAYGDFGDRALWHGINTLALLHRAQADGFVLRGDLSRDQLARDIIADARRMAATKKPADAVWDLATIAEAHIALGEWQEAELALSHFIENAKEPFTLNSTLRQFRQIWRLDAPDASEPARRLIASLVIALARMPDASLSVGQTDLEAVSTFGRQAAQTSPIIRASDTRYEALIDGIAHENFAWVDRLMAVAKGIVRIDTQHGRPNGTGFYVLGQQLRPDWAGRHLIITNEHVVSPNGAGPAIRPSSARIVFTRIAPQTSLRVSDVLWVSGRDAHDCCVLQIDPAASGLPEGIEPLEFSDLAQSQPDPSRHVTVIGHPDGGPLSLAIENLHIVNAYSPAGADGTAQDLTRLRYKASTKGGSSGSPVLDWRGLTVIGLHSRTSLYEPPSETAKPARARPVIQSLSRSVYRRPAPPAASSAIQVNEGTWLGSILQALKQT